jgi:D-aspartate ligase
LARHEPAVLLLGSDFKALGVARSLGRRGVRVAVVDCMPRSAWFSRHVRGRFRWRDAMQGPAFVDFLLDLARTSGTAGSVLWPAQDDALEAVARDWKRLRDSYSLVTQPWEVIRNAHDKKRLHAAADEVGVPHPATCYPLDEDTLRTLPIRYPAIVKPAVSITLQRAIGRKALAARDVEELVEAYRFARQMVPAGDLMVQEVILGGMQSSVGALADGGRVLSSMTARRTRQYPIDYGLGSSFVEAVPVAGIVDLAQKLIGRLGLSGMVEVEFIHDPRSGEPQLLDVNPRPWGWHSLCIASGLDFPSMEYERARGRPAPAPEPRYGTRWIRGLTDIPAGVQSVRAGQLTVGAYVRSLFAGRTVGSVFDLRDPLPAAGDLAVAAIRLGGALLRRAALPRLRRWRTSP